MPEPPEPPESAGGTEPAAAEPSPPEPPELDGVSALGAGLAVFVSVALGTCSCLKGLWTLPGRASSAAVSSRVTAALDVLAASCRSRDRQRGVGGVGGAPEVERNGEGGDQQEHGHGPQLALDEVAQQSAHGVHRATSEAAGVVDGAVPAAGVAPAALGVVVDGVVDVVSSGESR